MKRFPEFSGRIAGAEIFHERMFRAMLHDPEQLAHFAATFPSARTLFSDYLEAIPPTLSEFPADGVTALQFTLFDNGPQPSVSNGRLLTMKSQFALHIKAWDRLGIDWSKDHHVAWEATACLRSADETLAIVDDLIGRNLLPVALWTALEELVDATDHQGLYGVCHQRQPGRGSRWAEILVHVLWDGSGTPENAFVIQPDFNGYEAQVFGTSTATGSPLGGRAVAQARVAYHERFAGWATETYS